MLHSVVLTVYNAPKDVSFCLKSLENSLDFSETELVIVDDASEEETYLLLKSFADKHESIKLIRHTQNKGYLHSVNDGILACSSEIITLLNSDTYIPKDFSKRIFACFSHDEKIGVASPVLAHGNPFSVPPQLCDKFLDEASLISVLESMDAKAQKILPLYPDIVFPDGACFSFRKKCLDCIGLFDEQYSPGYFEELDFCMRAVEAGFRTVFIDNLYVYHKSHASFGKKKTSEYMQRNKKIFNDKWSDKYRALAVRFPKKQHKKRVFCAFYSYADYIKVELLLKLSRIIPCRSVRRKIRARYQ